jgi:hypothetical protein
MSWMTGCFSNLSKAGRPIPLEATFKLKTDQKLRSLYVANPSRYTFQAAPMGSYRTEHVKNFLEKHLLPWDEQREKAHDYRTRMMPHTRATTVCIYDDTCSFRTRQYMPIFHVISPARATYKLHALKRSRPDQRCSFAFRSEDTRP